MPDGASRAITNDLPCTSVHGPACNAFGINEAGSFTRSTIPWWSSCNPGSPSFTTVFEPLSNAPFGSSSENRKIVHEARLTKEADFDGNYDCEEAHANWMFPDGQRRELFIQTGWELYGTTPLLVNTYQVRNPSGNPAPGGDTLVIHGIGTTSLVDPPAGKEFRNWYQPLNDHSTDDQGDVCETKEYDGGVFNYNGAYAICDFENTSGPNKLWVVSSVNGTQRGRTLTTWHSNASEAFEESSQVCECRAHDSVELNGGTVFDFSSLPGGSTSILRRYHLGLATRACRNSGRMILRGTEDASGGTDSFRINGVVEAPPGILNESPIVQGAWLIVRSADGQQLHKIAIPSGFYSSALGRGWHLPGGPNPPGTAKWTYSATSAGALSGIRKLVIKVSNGKMSFKVQAKDSTYFIPYSDVPLRVALVLQDTPHARDAACVELTLVSCARSGDGFSFSCRRQRGELQ